MQHRTFCSKHVTNALKAGGIEAVHGANENIVTPSKLYALLQEKLRKERFVAGSVQYKMKALAGDAGVVGGGGGVYGNAAAGASSGLFSIQ